MIADIDLPEAQSVAGSLADAMAVRCDIASANEVEAMIGAVEKRYGHLDIIVNNASILDCSPWNDLDMANYRKVMEINMTGAVEVCRAGVPLAYFFASDDAKYVTGQVLAVDGGVLATF